MLKSPPVDTFITAVKKGISKLRDQTDNFIPTRGNMSSAEILAIKRLAQTDTLTLKPTDKEGALVVIDASLYLEEITRRLDDRNVYEVSIDPKFRLSRTINQLVMEALEANIRQTS